MPQMILTEPSPALNPKLPQMMVQLPAGAVGEGAMHQDHVLDIRHSYSPLQFELQRIVY
jgi:hypothetical protein